MVKNALLTSDRTVRRKIREFILSVTVEIAYSKDQILEMYLNQVPYGGTAYGIESAAQTYFGKSADKLDLAEAALLAGLPQAPSYYSPFGSHPEESKNRQKYVLGQMKDNKMISETEYDSALNEDLKFIIADSIKAPPLRSLGQRFVGLQIWSTKSSREWAYGDHYFRFGDSKIRSRRSGHRSGKA